MFCRLTFEYSEYMDMNKNCSVEIVNNDGCLSVKGDIGLEHHIDIKLNPSESKGFIQGIEGLGLNTWQDEYHPEGFYVLDGYTWHLSYEGKDPDECFEKTGSNAYPWCFYQLLEILLDIDEAYESVLGRYGEPIECYYDKTEGRGYDINEDIIVDYLKDHIGDSISSFLLIRETGSYSGDLDKADLFDLNRQVFIIAENNGFYLDMRHHDGKVEGLPYNLDFIIMKA